MQQENNKDLLGNEMLQFQFDKETKALDTLMQNLTISEMVYLGKRQTFNKNDPIFNIADS